MVCPEALKPVALVHEISLLLDYISGRPGISLPPPPWRLGGRLIDEHEALTKYFDICAKLETSSQGCDEMQFLVEARDYLNAAVSPASGSTIGFSLLVNREHPGSAKADEAASAFPQYTDLARSLRRWMDVYQVCALLVTLVVAVVSGYVYFGNTILARIAAYQQQASEIASTIAIREDQAPAGAASQARFVRYCAEKPASPIERATVVEAAATSEDEPPKPLVLVDDAHYHICEHYGDVRNRLDRSYRDLQAYMPFREHVTDQMAASTLAALNGYLVPVLLGLLGSFAFVLRSYLRALGARLLTPRDLRAYTVRLVLGTLSGLVIGFLLAPGSTPAQGNSGLANVVSVTVPSLAFLAGYSVEVAFRFFDLAAEQVFPGKA